MTQFTLLVPTYGRSTLLRRLLHYYENENFQHSIVIADSSDRAAFEENRETISRCHALRVTHISFDPAIEIYTKITNALNSIDTPYVGLCSDDDFIASRSIARSFEFLEKHPRYSAVQGRSFIAEISNDGLRVSAYPQHGVEGPTVTARIESYFRNPTSNFYAIYRTPIFKDILARISRYRTSNTRFEELAVSSLGAVSGNVAVLPTLHMVRQNSRNRTDSGSKQTGGWSMIMQTSSFAKDRGRFIDMLSEALCEHGVGEDPARKLITRCFDNYLAQALGTTERPRRLSLKERVIAATLSPASSASPVRRMGATVLMHISPRLQALHTECNSIIALIEKYPDGILKV